MKKIELDYKNDIQILEIIKKTILDNYPITNVKLDIPFDDKSVLNIKLIFYKNELGEEFTQILFNNGNQNTIVGNLQNIILNGLISKQVVINLISFILTSHDCIKYLTKDEEKFNLSFEFDITKKTLSGISCNNINLSLDFCDYHNHNQISNDYLKTIVKNFYPCLEHTQGFKEKYDNYGNKIKEKFVKNLTDEEVDEFINRLTKEELKKLLLNLSNERFTEIYQKIDEKESKQYIKRGNLDG